MAERAKERAGGTSRDDEDERDDDGGRARERADEDRDEPRDEGGDARDVKAELDERRIARGIAIGLPLVTLTLGLGAGVILGPAMAILVFAAGILLGVIALFWASLRVLSGDAALPPEIEALDATKHAASALATRKKMLLRAIKDLDVEHELGKLDDDDREQIGRMYRNELKDVMRQIDAALEPHRPKAEEAARSYLARVGLVDGGYRGVTPESLVEKDVPPADDSQPSGPAAVASADTRVACAKCETKNESDAAFCKKCGAPLAKDDEKADAKVQEKTDEA